MFKNPKTDCIATVIFAPKDNNPRYITDTEGNKHCVAAKNNHAMAITKAEGKNVTLVDSNFPEEEIVITSKELKNSAYLIQSCQFE